MHITYFHTLDYNGRLGRDNIDFGILNFNFKVAKD